MTRTFTNISWDFIVALYLDLPQSGPREVDNARDFDNHCNHNTPARAKDKDIIYKGFCKIRESCVCGHLANMPKLSECIRRSIHPYSRQFRYWSCDRHPPIITYHIFYSPRGQYRSLMSEAKLQSSNWDPRTFQICTIIPYRRRVEYSYQASLREDSTMPS